MLKGKVVKAARERLGMNQADFAKLLRISQPSVSRIENDTMWQDHVMINHVLFCVAAIKMIHDDDKIPEFIVEL